LFHAKTPREAKAQREVLFAPLPLLASLRETKNRRIEIDPAAETGGDIKSASSCPQGH